MEHRGTIERDLELLERLLATGQAHTPEDVRALLYQIAMLTRIVEGRTAQA